MSVEYRLTLLFDLRATQPRSSDVHGGSEYAKSVLRELAGGARKDIGVVYESSCNVDRSLLDLANGLGWRTFRIDDVSSLEQLLAKARPRRFFSALPYEYGKVNFGESELIATIHGLRPVEMPADAYAGKFARTPVERFKCWARMIGRRLYVPVKTAEFDALLNARARRRTFIVPSEYTSRSIQMRCRSADPSQIQVLYSPKTALAANAAAADFSPEVFDLSPRGYVLLVSADRWIKNSFRALLGIERLLASNLIRKKWPIVIAGNCPPGFPRRWRGLFRFLGRCDERTLAGLYANAGLFLYPTLNEGFGYPPLEAMSYGTPVLASAISAVPEIAGDGAAYFSPFDSMEIAVRLSWLLTDDDARQQLADAGRTRYAQVERRQERDLKTLCALLTHE